VRRGVAVPLNTVTSRIPSDWLENRMIHALLRPLEAAVVVDGMEVIEEALERRCPPQPAPAANELREVELTVRDVATSTEMPATGVQGPPAAELALGCAVETAWVYV
jgi:hypothetical protein